MFHRRGALDQAQLLGLYPAGERPDLDTLEAPRPLPRSALRARASSLYAAVFLDRGRSRKRIQAKIMLGSSYMARPTWLYLPGGILVLKDR